MDLAKLKEPFTASQINWRIGRKSKDKKTAIPFAYLTARDVMDRLDEVCGLDGWQAEYPFHGCCRIGVRISESPPEWIWRSNMADDTAIEAVKGGASDSFKRAAVLFGVGRYLYDLPNRYFPVGQYGFETEVIADLNKRYTDWIKRYFNQE